MKKKTITGWWGKKDIRPFLGDIRETMTTKKDIINNYEDIPVKVKITVKIEEVGE